MLFLSADSTTTMSVTNNLTTSLEMGILKEEKIAVKEESQIKQEKKEFDASQSDIKLEADYGEQSSGFAAPQWHG